MANDITIAFGIMFFLMIIGAAVPFINADFDTAITSNVNGTMVYDAIADDFVPASEFNCTQFYEQYAAGYGLTPPISEQTARAYGLPRCPGTITTSSIWTIIGSMFGMMFWSFGGIPVWLDITLFMALRITFFLLIARNIWVGGGG